MKTTLKVIGITLLSFVIIFAFGFLLNTIGLVQFKIFEPARENVKRDVFENTQSYVEGKRQEAVKYRLEYLKAKDEITRNALKSTIAHSFANFDETKLNDPILESFIRDMKYNQ